LSEITTAEIMLVGEDEIITSQQLTRGTPPGSKLTPEMVATICSYLVSGASIVHATRAAGVTPKTYRNWRDRGDADPNSGYAEAFGIFEMVRSLSIVQDIAYIRSGKPQWQSRAWRLERQFPNEFALHNRVSSTVDATHKLEIVFAKVKESSADDDQAIDVT
jgi:hypothetical protein